MTGAACSSWTALLEGAGFLVGLPPDYVTARPRLVGGDVWGQLQAAEGSQQPEAAQVADLVPLGLGVDGDEAPTCRDLPPASTLAVDRSAILWDHVQIGSLRRGRGGLYLATSPLLPDLEVTNADRLFTAALLVEALGFAEAAAAFPPQGFSTHWTIFCEALTVRLHTGAVCQIERVEGGGRRWRGRAVTGHTTEPVMTPSQAIKALWSLAAQLAAADDPALVLTPQEQEQQQRQDPS